MSTAVAAVYATSGRADGPPPALGKPAYGFRWTSVTQLVDRFTQPLNLDPEHQGARIFTLTLRPSPFYTERAPSPNPFQKSGSKKCSIGLPSEVQPPWRAKRFASQVGGWRPADRKHMKQIVFIMHLCIYMACLSNKAGSSKNNKKAVCLDVDVHTYVYIFYVSDGL